MGLHRSLLLLYVCFVILLSQAAVGVPLDDDTIPTGNVLQSIHGNTVNTASSALTIPPPPLLCLLVSLSPASSNTPHCYSRYV